MELKTIILLLLFLPIASSVPSLELQHESIQPGETVFATITSPENFTQQIEKSQVKFFDGRKQVTLETDIFFYEGAHYISIYTLAEANLTMHIENILYEADGAIQSVTLSKNLTIKKENLIDEETNQTYTNILRVKPGYIFSSSIPSIKLTNVGTRTLNVTVSENQVSINPLSAKEVDFIPEEYFSFTKISSYKEFLVPTVYTSTGSNTTSNQTDNETDHETKEDPEVKADLKASPSQVTIEWFTETTLEKLVELFNFGDDNITNLEVESSLDFISLNELSDMTARQIQNLTIKLDANSPGHFTDLINISYTQNGSENKLEIPITISILPKGTPEENFEPSEKNCSEMSGVVCSDNTFCNGTITFTQNFETCCLGSCVQEKAEKSGGGSSGMMIGIGVFALLGFIGYYFYKKQKQLESPKSKDALASSTENFEKRFEPKETKRTTDSLSKS